MSLKYLLFLLGFVSIVVSIKAGKGRFIRLIIILIARLVLTYFFNESVSSYTAAPVLSVQFFMSSVSQKEVFNCVSWGWKIQNL